MKANTMLTMLANRYANTPGPMRRQVDAATLLKMAPNLDEEASRVYLERFVSKWRVDLSGDDAHDTLPADYARVTQGVPTRSPKLIRRRPMTALEERVHEELSKPLVLDTTREDQKTDVTVTFEDRDGNIRAI